MNKKNSKLSGFTLVELIVVMMILVILSAMFIPSLSGYIDKAGESSATMEARAVVQAVQTLASENYVKNRNVQIFIGNGSSSDNAVYISQDEVFSLAEVGGSAALRDVVFVDRVKLSTLTYTDSTGSYDIIYTAGGGYDINPVNE